MATNLQYFLEWYAEHWILGLTSLAMICFTVMSSCGALASTIRRKD